MVDYAWVCIFYLCFIFLKHVIFIKPGMRFIQEANLLPYFWILYLEHHQYNSEADFCGTVNILYDDSSSLNNFHDSMATIQPQTHIARCMKFIVHHEDGNLINPIFWRPLMM
jgi:hypothetical protein